MFKQYSSIQNHYVKEISDFPLEPRFDRNVPWVVTEKVHGSNFSYVLTANDDATVSVQIAKRTEILVDNDPSYYPKAVRLVRSTYDEKVKVLFDTIRTLLKERNHVLKVANVFGELFGGHYPHGEVKNVHNQVPIQRHVYYWTDFDFYVFDISVQVSTVEREYRYYLPYDDMIHCLKESGFSCYAKELFRGTFQDCLQYDTVFDSTIPSYYGLPSLPEKTNISEGVIIKPIKDMYTSKNDRMMIKKKNQEFNEKVGKPVKAEKKPSTNTPRQFANSYATEALEEIKNYINNTNRLEGTISKLGDIYKFQTLRDQCIYMLAQDALKDYKLENEDVWNQVTKEDQKFISKSLPGFSKAFVSEYILNNPQD